MLDFVGGGDRTFDRQGDDGSCAKALKGGEGGRGKAEGKD